MKPRQVLELTRYRMQQARETLREAAVLLREESCLAAPSGIYWPNGYDFCPNFLHDEVPAISPVPA